MEAAGGVQLEWRFLALLLKIKDVALSYLNPFYTNDFLLSWKDEVGKWSEVLLE